MRQKISYTLILSISIVFSGSADVSPNVSPPALVPGMSKKPSKVWALDADLNSKLALSGSADTSLMLWDLERLECLRSFEGRLQGKDDFEDDACIRFRLHSVYVLVYALESS